MKDRYTFIALLSNEQDGVSVTFPDLPGCYPCGDNLEEALNNAREAMGLHLWGMEQDGEPIPKPTPLAQIKLDREVIPALVEVFMPSIRDRVKSRFVKKTLSLPAWLAAKADEDGVNCSKLFQSALIEYLGLAAENKP